MPRFFKTNAAAAGLVGSLISLPMFASAVAAGTHTFEAEKAARIGGASNMADRGASGRATAALTNSGQGITFARAPAAGKLAIRHASIECRPDAYIIRLLKRNKM